MAFDSIDINNFRSIENLRISNFKQINLITGRNNCGKTTMLEAMFLIAGMSNPQLPVTIQHFRDLIPASDDSLNIIFRNLNFDQFPHIHAVLDGTKRELVIKPKYSIPNNPTIINSGKISNNVHTVNGLSLEFNDGNSKTNFVSEISLSNNTFKISDNYKEKHRCSFHLSKFAATMLPQQLEKIIINKQMNAVIDVLKEIDNKIAGIFMGGGNGIIYADIGLDKLPPINIMGDGIRKILYLIAATLDMQGGGVLLIDEIENGLHYSALNTLWKALLKASEIYNVQLFATTHSNECIAALNSAYKETYQNDDKIRIFRIEKQENRHTAFEYSSEMIDSGIDNNIEMR
jgi:AAA15 family ATPase/GTPase